jgi:broad specificity phosphatase PhoE
MEDAGSGKRIVAFTSGGPIGVTVQFALGAPDRAALELNWRVRNSSLTEFVFTRDRFTLDMFNAAPHLDDEALLTYR